MLLPDGLLRGGVRRPLRRGIEVRFAVDFQFLILREQHTTAVCGAALGSPGPGARGSALGGAPGWPRRGGPVGLAKAYSTTTEQIVQANGLEEGQLPLGRMLLIPSVR